MDERNIQVSISEQRSVTAVMTLADKESKEWLFVYAPGAGSNISDSFGTYACHYLAARGLTSVRFQFPYMEARKRYPDPPNVLEDTWRKVIGAVRADGVKLVVGGRSMGGRIASQVVAQGETVGGILKGCVNSQAVYPLFEQDGLGAQERRYTAHEQGNHRERVGVKARVGAVGGLGARPGSEIDPRVAGGIGDGVSGKVEVGPPV